MWLVLCQGGLVHDHGGSFEPRLMLASTLKPDVGFTFKGLRLVSTYVDLFWKPGVAFILRPGLAGTLVLN